MKIQSKVDKDTTYSITAAYVRISRGGDAMRIPYAHIPNQAERFCEPIKEELMEIYKDRYKEKKCLYCGKLYHGPKAYCSDDCSKSSKAPPNRELEEIRNKSHLTEKLDYAHAKGISYAELQKRDTLARVEKIKL